MRRFLAELNPTLRGFLIICAIVLAIVVLQLQQTLVSLQILARVAFFLAIALVLYLLWRDRMREDIGEWPRRARAVFYGGVALIVAALAVFFWRGASGLDAVALLLVLVLAGFSMWRVWRDQHTWS
jgi:amino acid transporter